MPFSSGNLSLAFTAGIIAAFNPCGVALLPSYIVYLMGRGNNADRDSIFNTPLGLAVRGVVIGAMMTLGFVTIFLLAGLALSALGTAIVSLVPWFAVAVGAFLVIYGTLLLVCREIKIAGVSRLSSIVPSSPKGSGLRAFYMYGVGYALASLGCTLPIFLIAVFTSFTIEGAGSGLINFILYATGMGLTVTAISTTALLAGRAVRRWISRIVPRMNLIMASFLILTGGYLLYYWLWGPGQLLAVY